MTSGPSLSDPGYDRPATDDLIVGEILGRYRVLSILQRGGMGEICLAEDTSAPDHQVVIKRVLDDLVADEAYLTMFRDEARLMARLDHPNIVRVLDTPVVKGTTCLVMEFVPGRSVAQLLRRTSEDASRIPPTIALHIMAEALEGLHCAHTAKDERGRPLGIVHRDMSPGNILVSFKGDVKITDFGIAKSKLSIVATSVGMVKGTTRYLSPEQIRGGEVTPRSDLFACAALLVEMLSGIAIFDRGQVPPTLLAIVKGQRKAVDELLPFQAPDLAVLLEQALALSPVHRPASAAEMAASLRALAPTLGPPVTPADLGAYLARLFPRTGTPIAPSASSPTGATYLVESALATEDLVGPSQSGARPLDAREFDRPTPAPVILGSPVDPARPLLTPERLGAISRPVPAPTPAPPPPEEQPLDVLGAMDDAVQALVELSAARAQARQDVSAPARATPDPEAGVSDSAAEADAFALSNAAIPVAAWRLDMRSLGLGLVGGAAVAALVAWALSGRDPEPAERVVELPVVEVPAPAREGGGEDTDVRPEVATSTARGEVGFITVTRPAGGTVAVDGQRYKVPLRRAEVSAGTHRVVISKRRFQREVEVVLAPGQHLDLTRAEIQVVDPE
ncbi:MAG: serine/threonine protein kinase [Deltaproteobacteria bacterium]|nr:serine/threonine protein kinase [Deltaproteobacteria bacterium]